MHGTKNQAISETCCNTKDSSKNGLRMSTNEGTGKQGEAETKGERMGKRKKMAIY